MRRECVYLPSRAAQNSTANMRPVLLPAIRLLPTRKAHGAGWLANITNGMASPAWLSQLRFPEETCSSSLSSSYRASMSALSRPMMSSRCLTKKQTAAHPKLRTPGLKRCAICSTLALVADISKKTSRATRLLSSQTAPLKGAPAAIAPGRQKRSTDTSMLIVSGRRSICECASSYIPAPGSATPQCSALCMRPTACSPGQRQKTKSASVKLPAFLFCRLCARPSTRRAPATWSISWETTVDPMASNRCRNVSSKTRARLASTKGSHRMASARLARPSLQTPAPRPTSSWRCTDGPPQNRQKFIRATWIGPG